MASWEPDGLPEEAIGSVERESMITGRAGSVDFICPLGSLNPTMTRLIPGEYTRGVCSLGASGCCGTSPGGLEGTLAREGIMIGSFAEISFSIGLNCSSVLFRHSRLGDRAAFGVVDSARLPGTTIWDPQRLQNFDTSGTRFPHREQEVPIRGEASDSFAAGDEKVGAGTGLNNLFDRCDIFFFFLHGSFLCSRTLCETGELIISIRGGAGGSSFFRRLARHRALLYE